MTNDLFDVDCAVQVNPLARACWHYRAHQAAMTYFPNRTDAGLVASLLCADYELDEHEVLNRLNVDHYNVIADSMQAEGNPHGEWLTAWLLPDEQQRDRALLPLRSAMAEYVEAEVERLRTEQRARHTALLAAWRAGRSGEHRHRAYTGVDYSSLEINIARHYRDYWNSRGGKTTHVSELFGTVHDEIILDDLVRQEDVQPLLGIMNEVHEPAVAAMPKVKAERLSLETLAWLLDPTQPRER